MKTVIIKVDTGFVSDEHEEDTGLTLEEWKALSFDGQHEYLQGAIDDNISSYPVIENDDGDEEMIE